MSAQDGDGQLSIFSTGSDSSIAPGWNEYITASSWVNGSVSAASNPRTFSCTSSNFFDAQFSSSNNPAVFGQGQDTLLKNGVLMSLSQNVAIEQSIDVVRRKFGIDNNIPGLMGKVLDVLGSLSKVNVIWKPSNFNSSTSNIRLYRNSLWIMPQKENSLEITTAMTFGATITVDSGVIEAFQQEFKLSLPQNVQIPITSISLQSTRFVNRDPNTGAFSFNNVWSLKATIEHQGFVFHIGYSPTEGVTLALTESAEPKSLLARFSDLSTFGSTGDAPTSGDGMPEWTEKFKNVHLWYISVRFLDQKIFWALAFLIVLNINGQTTLLGLTYDSGTRTFTGSLLFRSLFPTALDRLLPHYNEIADLPPSLLSDSDFQVPGSFKLAKLIGNDVTLPQGVPDTVTKGFISYTKATTTGTGTNRNTTSPIMSISLVIDKESPVNPDDLSYPAPFEWNEIRFDLKISSTTSFEIFSNFQLNPRREDIVKYGWSPASLSVDVKYNTPKWQLSAYADNFVFGVLAHYVDSTCSDAILSMLGKLVIRSLDVTYTYTPEGAASSFLFQGVIDFGKLRLQLFYQYASKDADETAAEKAKNQSQDKNFPTPARPSGTKESVWEFDAYLGASVPGVTVKDIVDSIMGSGASDDIPGFVKGIEIPTAGTDASLITLKVAKVDVAGAAKDGKPPSTVQKIVFVFKVTLKFLEFTFAQVAGLQDKNPKRILRLSVGELPFFHDLPVVKELPQPYQKLSYAWVTNGPLLENEIKVINDQLPVLSRIYYQKSSKEAKGGGPPNAMIEGHHFIVVNSNEAVLDHVFGRKDPPASNTPAGGATTLGADAAARTSHLLSAGSTPATDSNALLKESPPTKGSMKKTVGPLSVSGLSLQYKDGDLWIFMDATLMLGPIEFSLLGFGVGLPLKDIKLNDLSTLVSGAISHIKFQLHGMAISFDQPPILIAGVFEHQLLKLPDGSDQDSYRGGVGIGFPPYTFAAVGEYSKVTKGTDEYKSVFIYAKLDGPIIDLELIIVKGIRIGFGFNSHFRSPATVQELPDVPLINDTGVSGAGNNPRKILDAWLGGTAPWVTPKHDNYWFAAGLTINCCDIVTATAVAVLEFGSAGVIARLFIDAIAQMPPEVKNEHEMIIYVEIMATAELNFVDDFFRIFAALAPKSFLLVPSCHLTGGFAFCKWFGRSPYAGDWVFTVGGYHRKFKVPSHYPTPDRLSIAYGIGDNISIRGTGYFAITPKAVMGGATIHVELSVSIVSAHLDAGFDAMIQFHPIHYWIEVHIEVGVSADIPFLFCTIHVSLDIGARLEIEGPEFGGVAHVDFWFFGFDVYFGAQPPTPPLIGLADFYALCAKAGPPDDKVQEPATDEITNEQIVQLKFNLEDGAFPKPTKDTPGQKNPDNAGAGAKWLVKGGSFRFRISSVFAIGDATLETQDSLDHSNDNSRQTIKYASDAKNDADNTSLLNKKNEIYSLPMKVTTKIKSPLYISITEKEHEHIIPGGWQPRYVVKPVAVALWASPNDGVDPTKAEGGTKNLVMAITLGAPPPRLAVSKIPPFDATAASKLEVLDGTKLKGAEPDQTLFKPAVLTSTTATQDDYTNISNVWATAAQDQDTTQSVIDSCMKALGWDKPAPDVKTKAEALKITPWQLLGKMPERLVKGKKVMGDGGKEQVQEGLWNLYMALPRVGERIVPPVDALPEVVTPPVVAAVGA